MDIAVNNSPRISRHLLERKYLLSAARCFNGHQFADKNKGLGAYSYNGEDRSG